MMREFSTGSKNPEKLAGTGVRGTLEQDHDRVLPREIPASESFGSTVGDKKNFTKMHFLLACECRDCILQKMTLLQ
jgi:hypothetical protein